MSTWTINFTKNGAKDFKFWQETDPKRFDRVRQLLRSIADNPLEGIGKPERLRHHRNPALYSRRIDQAHRLVYSIGPGNVVTVVACRYHYGDK